VQLQYLPQIAQERRKDQPAANDEGEISDGSPSAAVANLHVSCTWSLGLSTRNGLWSQPQPRRRRRQPEDLTTPQITDDGSSRSSKS
jgi:hypothetical protein